MISNDLSLTLGCNNDQTLIQDERMEQQTQTETQCFENHGKDSRVKEIDVAPTISAKAGTDGNNLPLAVEPGCIAFEPGIARREGDGSRFNHNESPTLRANMGDNLPAVTTHDEASSVICCHGSQDPIANEDHANAIGRNQGLETVVAQLKMPQMTVRRLMPVETELLMAMPPNHTIPTFKSEDITDELVDMFIEIFYNWDLMNRKPKKAKYAPDDEDDENEDDVEGETEETIADEPEPKAEITDPTTGGGTTVKRRSRKNIRAWLEKISNPKTCPDAPRYKACGNGFCCNVIRWIGLSIQAVEDKYAEQK